MTSKSGINNSLNYPTQRYNTTISQHLKLPSKSSLVTKNMKSAGTVLTSRENLKKLEDKRRIKEEKERKTGETISKSRKSQPKNQKYEKYIMGMSASNV